MKLTSFTNSVTMEWAIGGNRNNWNQTGMLRSAFCGDARAPRVSAAATAALGGDIALLVFTDTTHGSGIFAPGQLLTGIGVANGTRIVAYGTGTGANNGGTYTVNISQTVTTQTITGKNVSITDQASQPAGNTHPVAYVLAQKPGRISSRKICYLTMDGEAEATIGSLMFTSSCVLRLSGTATGTLIIGSLIDGTAAIIIDGAAVGSMTIGAAGVATISIESNGAILGHVPAEGSASILLGAVADLTALGWLSGSGSIELDGTLQSYAVGWLSGSTEDKNILTAKNIAVAVWEALQSEINTPGSAGAALLSAGSAGDPWTSLLANYTDDATFGVFVKKLLTTGKFIGLK